MKKFSHGEMATILAISIATVAIAFHIYEAKRPVSVTSIKSPVILNQDNYVPGDTIYGRFEGVLRANGPFIVSRTLQCATQRVPLVDVTMDNSLDVPLTQIESPIIILDPAQTKSGTPIKPDKNCSISFINTYRRQLPLGGERLLQASYFTDSFDIIPAE